MIITNDEAALRIDCTDVSLEDAPNLIEQLERELKVSESNGRPGIGLAAPQIGIGKNCAIIRTNNYSIDLINASIIEKYDKDTFEDEGCLSFPGRSETTMRYQEIVVRNNLFEPNNFIASGLLAVVIQHEMDHWNSILLPDIAMKKILNKKKKTRPNDKCPCDSGKKYKKCCSK